MKWKTYGAGSETSQGNVVMPRWMPYNRGMKADWKARLTSYDKGVALVANDLFMYFVLSCYFSQ